MSAAGPSLANPDFIATLGFGERWRLLERAGVEIAGCARGWAAVVGATRIEARELGDVVDTAVAVLALRRELWPSPTLAVA